MEDLPDAPPINGTPDGPIESGGTILAEVTGNVIPPSQQEKSAAKDEAWGGDSEDEVNAEEKTVREVNVGKKKKKKSKSKKKGIVRSSIHHLISRWIPNYARMPLLDLRNST
jgi:hypothetical protein